MKYILEIEPGTPEHPGRALTSISLNTIHFNVSGHMNWQTREEVEKFLHKWRNHFFGLQTLRIALVNKAV